MNLSDISKSKSKGECKISGDEARGAVKKQPLFYHSKPTNFR